MSQTAVLPPSPIAPWAATVPGVPPHMTMAEFLDYPGDDGYRYELVEGMLVRVAGTRPRAGRVTRNLLFPLAAYVREHNLGTVTAPDEVYDLARSGQQDTGLLPDIGFYYASRESLVDPDRPYPFAPDLAVEVASPTQYRPEMAAKVARYLAGGTSLVWVVWPQHSQVDVWHPGDHAPTTITVGAALTGENVVRGFTIPVGALFA